MTRYDAMIGAAYQDRLAECERATSGRLSLCSGCRKWQMEVTQARERLRDLDERLPVAARFPRIAAVLLILIVMEVLR